jgi:hypothetical protein
MGNVIASAVVSLDGFVADIRAGRSRSARPVRST